jgi:hypothetical protein
MRWLALARERASRSRSLDLGTYVPEHYLSSRKLPHSWSDPNEPHAAYYSYEQLLLDSGIDIDGEPLRGAINSIPAILRKRPSVADEIPFMKRLIEYGSIHYLAGSTHQEA